MSMSQNDDQRCSAANTGAVNNSSVLAESELGGASPIRRDDRPRDHCIPSNLTQAGCPDHRSGVGFVRCSNCSSGTSGSQARKSYGDANVTPSASTAAPPRPTDNRLAAPKQNLPAPKQVFERALNPGVSAGLDHSKNVEPRNQQPPSADISRGSSSRKMDMGPSAQQQARLGKTSAHETRPKNKFVAPSASSFDTASSDLFLESMASQYPVEKGGFGKSVNPYAQYFRTS